MRRANIGAFSPPVTTHRIHRERLIRGYVTVIRRLPLIDPGYCNVSICDIAHWITRDQ
jgi:hypothetical protein